MTINIESTMCLSNVTFLSRFIQMQLCFFLSLETNLKWTIIAIVLLKTVNLTTIKTPLLLLVGN